MRELIIRDIAILKKLSGTHEKLIQRLQQLADEGKSDLKSFRDTGIIFSKNVFVESFN